MTKSRYYFLILAVVLLLASCSTMVTYSVEMPSEVSLGNYKNIAVASTEPYKASIWEFSSVGSLIPVKNTAGAPGEYLAKIPKLESQYTSSEERIAAEKASKVLEKALDQGYYNIIGTKTTDAIITLGTTKRSVLSEMLANNVDVVVKSKISGMSHEEFVEVRARTIKDSETESHTAYDLYYMQKAGITLAYDVIDVKANNYITSSSVTKNFSDGMLLGTIDPKKDNGEFKKSYFSLTKFSSIYSKLLDSCYEEIRNTLVPHVETIQLSLQKNSAKDPAIENAYKFAEQGYNLNAYNDFYNHWTATGYWVSGYNAAVMLGANGDFKGASELALEVFNKTGKEEALKLSKKLSKYLLMQELVKEQMSNPASSGALRQELVGF